MLIDTNKDDKYLNGRYYFFQLTDTKRAAYFDLSNLNEDEGINLVREFINFFRENQFLNVTGRAFIDLTNTRLSHNLMLAFKEMAKAAKKITFQRSKIAGVGRVGMKNVYINIFTKLLNNNLRAFDTKEEAFAWLAED